MTKPTEEHRSDCELSNKDLIERCLASMKDPVTSTKRIKSNSNTRRRIEDIQMRRDLDDLELLVEDHINAKGVDNG